MPHRLSKRRFGSREDLSEVEVKALQVPCQCRCLELLPYTCSQFQTEFLRVLRLRFSGKLRDLPVHDFGLEGQMLQSTAVTQRTASAGPAEMVLKHGHVCEEACPLVPAAAIHAVVNVEAINALLR